MKFKSKGIQDGMKKRLLNEISKISKKALSGNNLWFNANFNPFGNDISDCMVRAISAALMMKYDRVCAVLGKKMSPGYGLEDKGIPSGLLMKKFPKYFKEVEVGVSSYSEPYDVTVKDAIEEFSADPEKSGIYLFSVKGHILYACCRPDEKFFIDTWDSRDQIVKDAYKVMHQCGKNSPYRLRYSEFVKMQDAYDNEGGKGRIVRDLIARFDKWIRDECDIGFSVKNQDVLDDIENAETVDDKTELLASLLNGACGVKELACHNIPGFRGANALSGDGYASLSIELLPSVYGTSGFDELERRLFMAITCLGLDEYISEDAKSSSLEFEYTFEPGDEFGYIELYLEELD